jgi:hypothetical protein
MNLLKEKKNIEIIILFFIIGIIINRMSTLDVKLKEDYKTEGLSDNHRYVTAREEFHNSNPFARPSPSRHKSVKKKSRLRRFMRSLRRLVYKTPIGKNSSEDHLGGGDSGNSDFVIYNKNPYQNTDTSEERYRKQTFQQRKPSRVKQMKTRAYNARRSLRRLVYKTPEVKYPKFNDRSNFGGYRRRSRRYSSRRRARS